MRMALRRSSIRSRSSGHHAHLHRSGAQHQGGPSPRPEIARKAHIVVREAESTEVLKTVECHRDWNVRADVVSWRAMVAAPWSITTSPLDASPKLSCAAIDMPPSPGRNILWRALSSRTTKAGSIASNTPRMPAVCSSTAAIYLAYSEEFARIEPLKLIVDDEEAYTHFRRWKRNTLPTGMEGSRVVRRRDCQKFDFIGASRAVDRTDPGSDGG